MLIEEHPRKATGVSARTKQQPQQAAEADVPQALLHHNLGDDEHRIKHPWSIEHAAARQPPWRLPPLDFCCPSLRSNPTSGRLSLKSTYDNKQLQNICWCWNTHSSIQARQAITKCPARMSVG